MPIIQTPSFNLSVYEKGDDTAEKVALVLPGRLESKDYAHIRAHVDTLAQIGYQATAFDPPGSWESPGSISNYTWTNYLKATEDLITHYGNKPTLLIGHSLGANIAMLQAASNDSVIGYVSLMGLPVFYTPEPSPPVLDEEWHRDGFVTFYRDMPPGDHHTSEQRRYDLPYSYLEDSYRYPTGKAIQECNKPKLFVLGRLDTQHKPELIRNAFEYAAEPKQLVEVDMYHAYRYASAQIAEIDRIILDFAQKQL